MKRILPLCFFAFFAFSAFAQIPNAGFETWTTVGSYHTPTSWDNPNATTSIASTYTCDSSMVMPPQGVAYLCLVSKTVPLVGVVPGVAVTGQIVVSGTTYSVKGGFVNTTRPVSLTGKIQHKPKAASSDHGRIGVFLWKWNTTLNKRDTVALKDSTLSGSAITWTAFSLPLTYSSGSVPDSALIIFSSSATSAAATDSSYLLVDDVAFSGTVPTGLISVVAPEAANAIFPNPASGSVTVHYHSAGAKSLAISISDITGSVVRSMTPGAVSGENRYTIDIKDLAQGMYLVRIQDEHAVEQHKLMVE